MEAVVFVRLLFYQQNQRLWMCFVGSCFPVSGAMALCGCGRGPNLRNNEKSATGSLLTVGFVAMRYRCPEAARRNFATLVLASYES